MSESPTDELSGPLRSIQLIIASLLAGVAAFTAIAIYLRASGTVSGEREPPTITYIALAFAVVEIVVSVFLPRATTTRNRTEIARGTWPSASGRPRMPAPLPTTDAGKLALVHNSQLIIGCALLEGAAFFLLIAYLLEGQYVALIAALLLGAAITFRFPTQPRHSAWIEEQLRLLEAQRLGG